PEPRRLRFSSSCSSGADGDDDAAPVVPGYAIRPVLRHGYRHARHVRRIAYLVRGALDLDRQLTLRLKQLQIFFEHEAALLHDGAVRQADIAEVPRLVLNAGDLGLMRRIAQDEAESPRMVC